MYSNFLLLQELYSETALQPFNPPCKGKYLDDIYGNHQTIEMIYGPSSEHPFPLQPFLHTSSNEPKPVLEVVNKNSSSAPSSVVFRYGFAPIGTPCVTHSLIRSCKVVVSTPYSLEAQFTPISPSYTALIAASMTSLLHCLSFEGRLLLILLEQYI